MRRVSHDVRDALRQAARVAAVAAAATLVAANFWTAVLAPSLRSVTHGFPLYYASSRLVLEGRWSDDVYRDAWFGDEVHALSNGRVTEIFWPNPPATALMLLPFASLPMAEARTAWLVVSLAALATAIRIMTASLRGSATLGVYAVVLALAFGPLRQNFRFGQAYAVLLLLFALAWSGARRDRVAPGVALGLAAALKWQGAPVWAMLAAAGRWRTVAAAAATVMITSIGTSVLLGWWQWPEYLASLLSPGRSWLRSPEFQGTPNLIAHLLVGDAAFNPDPPFHAPLASAVLSALAAAAALAFTMWRARDPRADPSLVFAAGLTLSVVLSPFALDYHFSLLLLPIIVFLDAVMRSRAPGDAAWLAAVIALTAPPWRHYFPVLDDIAYGLFAYVRLYGAWLLWIWLVIRIRGTTVDARRRAQTGG